MSEYDELLHINVIWKKERWNMRKEMATDVWKDESEEQMKYIIALLIFHAPEVIE